MLNRLHGIRTSLFLLTVNQMTFIRIHQRLPTGVDDVAADADGAEDFLRAVGLFAATFDRSPAPARLSRPCELITRTL